MLIPPKFINFLFNRMNKTKSKALRLFALPMAKNRKILPIIQHHVVKAYHFHSILPPFFFVHVLGFMYMKLLMT